MSSEILANIASIVAKSAPLLGTVLGSPLAGMGIGLLASHFGVKDNNLQNILDVLTQTPDTEVKLKQIEFDYKQILVQAVSENYKTEVDDRKDARAREIALHDHVPTILAIGFMVFYALIQFYCVTHNNSINDIISARFQDILIMIISYYFGSSHSDKPAQLMHDLDKNRAQR